MSRRGLLISILFMAAVAYAGVWVFEHFLEDTTFGASTLSPWRRVSMRVGNTVDVDVRSVSPPLPYTTIPLAQTNRDTLLDTWVSMQSYAVGGKDDVDLEVYLDHYLEPGPQLGRFRSRGLVNATAVFAANRSAAIRLQVIGVIRRGDNYILACRYRLSPNNDIYAYTYEPFVKTPDGFFWHAFRDARLLRVNDALLANGYSELTDPEGE